MSATDERGDAVSHKTRGTSLYSEEANEEDTFTAELFSSHSIHTPPEPFQHMAASAAATSAPVVSGVGIISHQSR